MKHAFFCAVLACAGLGSLRADFSYQENTKITGGAMQSMMRVAGAFSKAAREPIASTVAVSGHRMAHINAHTAQIIDLDKETITDVNFDRKTYTVQTFAQFKQALDDMAARMQQSKNENAPDIKFKASAKATGQTKIVEGLNAREMLVTLTMEGTDKQTGNSGSMDITSDMWIAPVAGYDEVRNFYKVYAAKVGMMPGQNAGMMAMQPAMVKGMTDLAKEISKLDGAPVQMITRIGGTGTGTGAAASQDSSAANPQQSAREAAASAALGKLGLGGFGRRKKPADDQQQQQQASGETQTSSGLLMETTTEASGFSAAAVDPSKFEVPSGFKQVEPEMGRRPSTPSRR